MMTKFFTRDRIIAVILFAASSLWGYLALQMPPSYVKGVPGPGFFPLAIVLCLLVLCTVLFFRRSQPGEEPSTRVLTPRELTVFAMIALYILLVPYLGFPAATSLALFGVMSVSRRQSTAQSLITALAIAICLYLIFKVFLKIPLPEFSLFQ